MIDYVNQSRGEGKKEGFMHNRKVIIFVKIVQPFVDTKIT
jgi:hypothetical protein